MEGLYNKYNVSKADGSPVDPEAIYIVLRVDKGEYVHACRAGVMAFARAVRPINPQLHDDLVELLSQYPMGHAMVREGWTMPTGKCPSCSSDMEAVAVHTGDGWGLYLECPKCGDYPEEDLEWPLVVDYATGADLEAAGFRVE